MSKFIRQANLPNAAYKDNELSGLAYFMAKDIEKRKAINPNTTFCPCNLFDFYDPTKYKGCYKCFKNQFSCCKERENK